MNVSKNRGKTSKMDGENNGKPYEQMDDLGGFTTISGNTHMYVINLILEWLSFSSCYTVWAALSWHILVYLDSEYEHILVSYRRVITIKQFFNQCCAGQACLKANQAPCNCRLFFSSEVSTSSPRGDEFSVPIRNSMGLTLKLCLWRFPIPEI